MPTHTTRRDPCDMGIGGVRGTAAIGGGETHVTAFRASCIVGEYAGGRI